MKGNRKLLAYLLAVSTVIGAEIMRLLGVPISDAAIDSLIPLLGVFVGGNAVEHVVSGVRQRRRSAPVVPGASVLLALAFPFLLVITACGGVTSTGERGQLLATGSGHVEAVFAEGLPPTVTGAGRVELSAEGSTVVEAGPLDLALSVNVHALADSEAETAELLACLKAPAAQAILRAFGVTAPLCLELE